MTIESGSTAPTTVILIRHGETLGNRHRQYQAYDTPLSDAGREQARRLAERLAAEVGVDALYTSDLERTRETAAILGQRLGLAAVPSAALRELDVGDWKGQTYETVEATSPGGLRAWIGRGGQESLPGPNGESAADLLRRAGGFLEDAIERHPGQRIALVTHGLTLRVLLALCDGRDPVEALGDSTFSVGNTSVSVVEVRGAERRCILRTCTAHLDGMAEIAAGTPGAV